MQPVLASLFSFRCLVYEHGPEKERKRKESEKQNIQIQNDIKKQRDRESDIYYM